MKLANRSFFRRDMYYVTHQRTELHDKQVGRDLCALGQTLQQSGMLQGSERRCHVCYMYCQFCHSVVHFDKNRWWLSEYNDTNRGLYRKGSASSRKCIWSCTPELDLSSLTTTCVVFRPALTSPSRT